MSAPPLSEAELANLERQWEVLTFTERRWLATVRALQQQHARLMQERDALRTHQGRIFEAAERLLGRFGKDVPEVMDVWSWCIINPEPPTAADLAATKRVFGLLEPIDVD